MHLDDTQLQTLRSSLSDKGRLANEGLIALQGGKPLPAGVLIPSIPSKIDPTDPMDVRLKQFLTIIHAKMKLIREGGEGYGVCGTCKEPLAFDVLQNEPWIDVCSNCG